MATATELIAQLRLDLDDPELPGAGDDSDSLWLDSELLHYLDEAQRRFAVDTECLPDFSSFTSTLAADRKWVDKDPSIIRIREGWLTTAQRTIKPITMLDINRGYITDDYGTQISGQWRTATGRPQYVVVDVDALQNRLVPIPTESDTIEWSVYRLPAALETTADDLEIEERFHYDLLVWAKVLAFKKQDSETQDMTRARDWTSEWNSQVIPEARKYFLMKFRKVGVTAYGGI